MLYNNYTITQRRQKVLQVSWSLIAIRTYSMKQRFRWLSPSFLVASLLHHTSEFVHAIRDAVNDAMLVAALEGRR